MHAFQRAGLLVKRRMEMSTITALPREPQHGPDSSAAAQFHIVPLVLLLSSTATGSIMFIPGAVAYCSRFGAVSISVLAQL